jgi:signal transduction histidine kinase
VLFRVVQEALSNVRKHSEAGRVSVALRSRRTFVEVTVTDDGCGFAPQQLDTDRLGLAGISERVRLLGGAVQIETSPGAGTTVRATLPQWRPSTPAAATIYAASS